MLDDPWAVAPPNVRSAIVPDPGYALVEVDLSGADAQVVAWDAGCETLKRVLRSSGDLHTPNAYHLYGRDIPNPRTSLHINGKTFRDNAKVAVHLADYTGGYRTLASSCSVSEDKSRRFIQWWTHDEHPSIGEWHQRVEYDLRRRKMPVIRNAFGFRRVYTDRPDRLLGQALAWIAQSTVAIVINHAMLALWRAGFELLLQVHDSVLMQIPLAQCPEVFPQIIELTRVVVPYDDPLIIPVELKWSASDWGSMEKWNGVL
jgi:DNA polymerase I-like protein with 3'-5' exonuclease and polymerase domains